MHPNNREKCTPARIYNQLSTFVDTSFSYLRSLASTWDVFAVDWSFVVTRIEGTTLACSSFDAQASQLAKSQLSQCYPLAATLKYL